MKEFDTIHGELSDRFGGILDTFFRNWGIDNDYVTGMSEMGRLPVSIKIIDSQAVITLECAGYSKEDLSIHTQGIVVTISGDKGSQSGFTKTFRVDTERFDINSVKAGYKNGLLTVTMDRIRKPEINTEKRTVTIQ